MEKDNTMDPKEYLKQVEAAEARIKNKLELLEDLKLKATAIGGFSYSGDKVRHSPGSGKIEDAVTGYVDFENEIRKDIEGCIALKRRIANEIDGLDDPRHIRLLAMRYVRNLAWREIADAMDYDETYVKRDLHRSALKEFGAKYLDRQPPP